MTSDGLGGVIIWMSRAVAVIAAVVLLVGFGRLEIQAIRRMILGRTHFVLLAKARRSIPSNGRIQVADFRWSVDSIRTTSSVPTDEGDIENHYAATDLIVGAVLSQDRLHDRPAYPAPDPIHVTIVSAELKPDDYAPGDIAPGDRVDVWSAATGDTSAPRLLTQDVTVWAIEPPTGATKGSRAYLMLSPGEAQSVLSSRHGVFLRRVVGARLPTVPTPAKQLRRGSRSHP